MDLTRYEYKWPLVYRIWTLFDSLRTGGISIESLRGEDGSDFGWDFWIVVRSLGRVDASGIYLGLVGGDCVHGIFGGGFHLAGGGGMDGCRGG